MRSGVIDRNQIDGIVIIELINLDPIFYDGKAKRCGSLLTRSPGIERLATHPLVVEIVEQMLLP